MTLPWHITCTCFSRHALLIPDPVYGANVVNVYINYLRFSLDSGYDRALISNDPGCWLSDRLQRPAHLVGTKIDCLRGTEFTFHRAKLFLSAASRRVCYPTPRETPIPDRYRHRFR